VLGHLHQRLCAGLAEVVPVAVERVGRPMGAAEEDRGVGGSVLRLQRLADAVADLGDLAHRIAQFIDAVHEDDDVAGADVGDHPDQRHVDRRQRLVRRQDHDADPARPDRVDGDLLAHEEGVVHAGRVAHAHRPDKALLAQVEFRRLGDVGEPALPVVGLVDRVDIIAEADVALHQFGIDIAVIMLLPEQQLEPFTEALTGFLAHLLELRAHGLQFLVGAGTAGQFAHAATAVQEVRPFLFAEEAELGVLSRLADARRDVQRRDDRGPRVDIRRQQARAPTMAFTSDVLPAFTCPIIVMRRLEGADAAAQIADRGLRIRIADRSRCSSASSTVRNSRTSGASPR
jgi:hypothetical protein